MFLTHNFHRLLDIYSIPFHPLFLAKQLKIDDKGISTRESCKRQIIIARRQKQPSSFGFYSPAKDDAECGGIINRKKVLLAFPVKFM